MHRTSILSCLMLVLGIGAVAQSQSLPPDLSNLPEEIKSVKWQSIDVSTASTLERCRALLLLNHVLDELSANVTAEADLMSTYIEKQNLGSQFANTAPPPGPKQLTYADAEKISIALLRGPMSKSYYASELGDVSAGGLASYEQMYEHTCQRRWSEFDESRHQLRCMASFLGNSQKLADYDAWATAESALRQKKFETDPAARAPAAQVNASQQQMQKLEVENRQLQQALGAAEYQTASAQAQAAQAQQPGQSQQQAGQAQQSSAGQPSNSQGYVAGYPTYGVYGGYGAYGAYGTYSAAAAGAYAGSKAANDERNNVAAGQYHGANSSWNHEEGYGSAARAQTEHRMSSFHGGGRR